MAKGDSVFFAVRCKVVSMPDNIVAGWVSVAVRYFKLKGWKLTINILNYINNKVFFKKIVFYIQINFCLVHSIIILYIIINSLLLN